MPAHLKYSMKITHVDISFVKVRRLHGGYPEVIYKRIPAFSTRPSFSQNSTLARKSINFAMNVEKKKEAIPHFYFNSEWAVLGCNSLYVKFKTTVTFEKLELHRKLYVNIKNITCISYSVKMLK